MLTFDAATSALLEDAYAGAYFTARRRANFDALTPRPGQSLLDLGCGNGMLTIELSRAVGPEGRVHGLDQSQAMLDAGAGRLGERKNVTLKLGSANSLPYEDGSLDGIVSIQVFEYIDDVPAALAEAARVLRPGGRLVIGDMHFGTLVWASDDPDRMTRMCASWDRHVVHTDLPGKLPFWMEQAGLRHEGTEVLTEVDTDLRPDGLARMMLILMSGYARQNGHLAEAEIDAWEAEQQQRARDGGFFMSLSHYVTVARKP